MGRVALEEEMREREREAKEKPTSLFLPLGMVVMVMAALAKNNSRDDREKSMPLRLAGEILDASQGKGAGVKKREDVHRMAEANKAFSHYRF